MCYRGAGSIPRHSYFDLHVISIIVYRNGYYCLFKKIIFNSTAHCYELNTDSFINIVTSSGSIFGKSEYLLYN